MSSPRYFSEKGLMDAAAPRGRDSVSGAGEPLTKKKVELKAIPMHEVDRIPESTKETRATSDRRTFIGQEPEDKVLSSALFSPAERARIAEEDQDTVVKILKALPGVKAEGPEKKDTVEGAEKMWAQTQAKIEARAKKAERIQDRILEQRRDVEVHEQKRRQHAEQKQERERAEELQAELESILGQADGLKKQLSDVSAKKDWDALESQSKALSDRMLEASQNEAAKLAKNPELVEKVSDVVGDLESGIFEIKQLEQSGDIAAAKELLGKEVWIQRGKAGEGGRFEKATALVFLEGGRRVRMVFEEKGKTLYKNVLTENLIQWQKQMEGVEERVAKESEAAIDYGAMREFADDLGALHETRRINESTKGAQQSVDAYWDAKVQVQRHLAETGEKIAPKELVNAQAKAQKEANQAVQLEIEMRMNPKEKAWAAETRALEARKKGGEKLSELEENDLRSRLSLEKDERKRYIDYHMAGTELQRLTASIIQQYEKHPDDLKEGLRNPPKGLWNRIKNALAPDRKLASLLEAYDQKTIEYNELRDTAIHFGKESSVKVFGGSNLREGGIGLGMGGREGADLFEDRPHKLEKDRAAELADQEAINASGELTLEQQRERYVNAGISPAGAEELLAWGEFGADNLNINDRLALEKLQEHGKTEAELQNLKKIAEAYIQDIKGSTQFGEKDMRDLRDAVTNLRMKLGELEGADQPEFKAQRKETWDAMMKFKRLVDQQENAVDGTSLTNEAVAEVVEKGDFEALARSMFAARKSLEKHEISLKEAQTVMKEFEKIMAKQSAQSGAGERAFKHAYEIYDELKESIAIYEDLAKMKKELSGKKPDLQRLDTELERMVNRYKFLESDSAFQEVDRMHHELWEAAKKPEFETAWKLMDTISTRSIALSKQMKQMPVGQLGPLREEAKRLRRQLEGLATNNAHLPDDLRYQSLIRDVKNLEKYAV